MNLKQVLLQYGSMYAEALISVWLMTLVSFVCVLLIALGITVLRVSPVRPLRRLGDFYVQVFRNIPGMSLLIVMVYALPYLQIVLDYRACVMSTVVLIASAFGSENFMTGINTIGRGQIEAARSLGMSFGTMMRTVIVPQALRTVVLPMTNLMVATMLGTALGSQVPLAPPELTGLVSYINTRTVGGTVPFLLSAALYILSASVIGVIGNAIDKKVRISR